MISLFLTFAIAACPPMFGKQNADGSWSFAEGAPQADMVSVEVDEFCKARPEDLVKSGKVFKVDKTKKKLRDDAEALEKTRVVEEKAAIKALKQKIEQGENLSVEELSEAVKLVIKKQGE